MNLFKKIFGSKKTASLIKKNRPQINYSNEGIRPVNLLSKNQFVSKLGDAGFNIQHTEYLISSDKTPTNSKVYEVSVKDVATGSYLLSPTLMKVLKYEVVRATLQGIYADDPDNFRGKEYSDISIQFIMSAMSGITGQPGTAVLVLENENKSITFQ